VTVSDDFGPLARAAKGGTRRHIVFVPPALGSGQKQKDKKKKRSRWGETQIQMDFDKTNSDVSQVFIVSKTRGEHTRRASFGSDDSFAIAEPIAHFLSLPPTPALERHSPIQDCRHQGRQLLEHDSSPRSSIA